jgi:hypothetical protein
MSENSAAGSEQVAKSRSVRKEDKTPSEPVLLADVTNVEKLRSAGQIFGGVNLEGKLFDTDPLPESKKKTTVFKPDGSKKETAVPTPPPPRGTAPFGHNAGPAKDSVPTMIANPNSMSRFYNIIKAASAKTKANPLDAIKKEWDESGLDINRIILNVQAKQVLSNEEFILWLNHVASEYKMEFTQDFDTNMNRKFRSTRKMLIIASNEIVEYDIDGATDSTEAVTKIQGIAFLPLTVALMIGVVNKNKSYKEFSIADIDNAVRTFMPLYNEVAEIEDGWKNDWKDSVICNKGIREDMLKACIVYIVDRHSHITTGFPKDMPKLNVTISKIFSLYYRATVQFIKQKRELQDTERFYRLEAARQKIQELHMSDGDSD